MSHVISPQFPMSEHDAISLLENLDRENAYLVPKITGAWGRVAVWRLTNNLVVKSRSSRPSHDIFTMGLVASETTIPVPRVQPCLRWKNSWWLVMDYVEGVDLKDEWPSLTSDERKEVAETLSSYVQQLRNIKLSNPSIPGPIDGTGASLPCEISCCRDPLGPFDSCSKMSSWFSKRFNWFINRPHNTLFGEPSSAERSLSDCIDWDWNTLYLTHGDISLSNARRDKDGKIWLLDWEFSGAYPIFFEYTGIKMNNAKADSSWKNLAPVVAGHYERQFDFFTIISATLEVYVMDAHLY